MERALNRGTYEFSIPENINRFALYNNKGEMYYIRELDGATTRLKVNICHDGLYRSKVPFKIVSFGKLDNSAYEKIILPEPERNKEKYVRIEKNFNIGHTPARIFANTGLIELGERFFHFPPNIRLFILLHEYGHFFYETEDKADLFALRAYLMLGYNPSNALYALTKVLHPSEDATRRINNIFEQIKK